MQMSCCFISACSDVLLQSLLKQPTALQALTDWLHFLLTTLNDWTHQPCLKRLFTAQFVLTQTHTNTHRHTHTLCFYILKRSKRFFSDTSSVMFPTHRERQLLEDRDRGGSKEEDRKEIEKGRQTAGVREQKTSERRERGGQMRWKTDGT